MVPVQRPATDLSAAKQFSVLVFQGALMAACVA